MQKFKKTRWAARNPAGDLLRNKLLWATTWLGQLASPAIAVSIPAAGTIPFLMTDLYEILTSALWSGTSHPRSSNSFQAAVLFANFRVTGVKIQWQSSVTGVSGTGSVSGSVLIGNTVVNTPYKFGIACGGLDDGTTTSLPINTFITPEQRWSIMRDVDQPGAPKRWHKVYFSIRKLIGIGYNKTDSVYAGKTDATQASGFAAAPTSRPLLGPWLRMGICTASGLGTTATYDPIFVTQMRYTFYTEYFGKIQNLTQ